MEDYVNKKEKKKIAPLASEIKFAKLISVNSWGLENKAKKKRKLNRIKKDGQWIVFLCFFFFFFVLAELTRLNMIGEMKEVA